MNEASMRRSILTWAMSSTILIGGALLAALAQGEPPETQFKPAPSIDTRELTEKATDLLPLQFYDVI
jgi:hypothetical protein